MKKGDTLKDVLNWANIRREHLRLEKQKVPFTIKEELRERVIRKLEAKIEELSQLIKVLNGDIKSSSKFEWEKVQYLKSKKIEKLKDKTN